VIDAGQPAEDRTGDPMGLGEPCCDVEPVALVDDQPALELKGGRAF
jgi:hypothetical protein